VPEAEIKKRGGAKRYRTIVPKPGKYIHVAVVPKAGPRGGHTVAGSVHTTKKIVPPASRRPGRPGSDGEMNPMTERTQMGKTPKKAGGPAHGGYPHHSPAKPL
jgi:hypothetical protein